ncbi:MAG TPA: MazG nucleotide pyrophosphohydrolase domain-containing protein, partial [bacterium]|nr:MazG nucleotide pyrophosphohydrolase domain-containing protein [bacterium]
RDRARGLDGTFRRLVEEVGEVAKSLRSADKDALAQELSDVLAWTLSVAVLCGVDLAQAASRYARGCPRCGESPCRCVRDWTPPAPAGRRSRSRPPKRSAYKI